MKRVSFFYNKLDYDKVVLLLVIFFFILNSIWVKLDTQTPFTGDDARYLQGTYDMYVPLSRGNFDQAWNIWQDIFIHPGRLPHTPLFALLSVPTFILFGPHEDVAIITNVLVLATNSLLLYYLVRLLFPGSKNARLTGLLTVVLYNIVPGAYGYARIYFSETLQTFFVLLITYQLFQKQKKITSSQFALLLGIFAALAFLLRFIIFIYLSVPIVYFLWNQLKQKKHWNYYAKSVLLFLLTFVPVSLTWYAKNFNTYAQFAAYTSVGDLTKYFSLGPSYDPRTIARFWYVIAIWVFGWPLIVCSSLLLMLLGIKKYKQVREFLIGIGHKWKIKLVKIITDTNFYLFIIPLPALLVATASEGKTARYFAPVIVFWLILLAKVIIENRSFRVIKLMATAMLVLCSYTYVQSLIPGLTRLPNTNLNHAAGIWDKSNLSSKPYKVVIDFLYKYTDSNIITTNIYNTAEQPRFNDAELIWYATQQGIQLKNTDEFSRYSDVNKAYKQIDNAEIVLVDTNPEVNSLWADKYKIVREYALNHPDFFVVTEQNIGDGSIIKILLKNHNYGGN